ncbi:hypothetical protein DH2020_006114 [Rehmannia glutinosa]|uniref:Uncharacterized protein n=1 Tax=Rehmannia glutinosa TaxID=99300 RepID=A0ABR0XHY0_REHGL
METTPVSLQNAFIMLQSNLSPILLIKKDSYSHSSLDDQIDSRTRYLDQFLTDVLDMDSVDPNKSSEKVDQPPHVVTGAENLPPEYQYYARILKGIDSVPTIITSEIETVHKEDASVDVSPLGNQDQDFMTEHKVTGQVEPLGQFSQLLSGSRQIEKEIEDSVEVTGAVSTEPFLKKARNDPEAFQHCGVPTRRLQFEDAWHWPAQNTESDGGSEKCKSSPKRQAYELSCTFYIFIFDLLYPFAASSSYYSGGDGGKQCNCKLGQCLDLKMEGILKVANARSPCASITTVGAIR